MVKARENRTKMLQPKKPAQRFLIGKLRERLVPFGAGTVKKKEGSTFAGEGGYPATISWMGWAFLSTMRIGRPAFELFCLRGSMPKAKQMVTRKSPTDT